MVLDNSGKNIKLYQAEFDMVPLSGDSRFNMGETDTVLKCLKSLFE